MDQRTNQLMAWYATHRRVLPWREDPTPYHVWVSEIMLQQTRVEVVKGYYERFMQVLPRVEDLAQVDEDRLMKLWQGLGYYSRAKNLRRAAIQIVENGEFPDTVEELLRVPGIGPYTAGAIASIAFGRPVLAPDGNAYRIAARLSAEEEEVEKQTTKKRLETVLMQMLDPHHPGDFNQALMDLGALRCLPHGQPLCAACPLQADCKARDPLAYPRRKPKKKRRVEEKTVYLVCHDGRILLTKRPDQGLLAGLWSLPMDDAGITLDEAEEKWGGRANDMASSVHVFTHVEWKMKGIRIDLDDTDLSVLKENVENYRWAGAQELEEEIGIPSAYRPFLPGRSIEENGSR